MIAHRFVNNCWVASCQRTNAHTETKEELPVIKCQCRQLGDEAGGHHLLEHSCQEGEGASVMATGSASPPGESQGREERRTLKHSWLVAWNMQSYPRPTMKWQRLSLSTKKALVRVLSN